jgi:hypothetical protein
MIETEAPVALNTPHARDMLRKRYAAPEWALMEEVAPATGGGTRYADGVAVNLWQSRGHAIYGFEIKVSRSDWLRELKQPEKAEPIFRFCDRWYIVAPRGIVKDGELPPSWGLLELRATGLVETVAGKNLEAQPVTKAFFASLMRRGHEQLETMARHTHQRALSEAREEMKRYADEEVARRTKRDAALREHIAKFEQETGLSLDEWKGPSPKSIKLAQQLEVLSGYGSNPLGALDKLAKDLERLAVGVRKAVSESGLAEAEA